MKTSFTPSDLVPKFAEEKKESSGHDQYSRVFTPITNSLLRSPDRMPGPPKNTPEKPKRSKRARSPNLEARFQAEHLSTRGKSSLPFRPGSTPPTQGFEERLPPTISFAERLQERFSRCSLSNELKSVIQAVQTPQSGSTATFQHEGVDVASTNPVFKIKMTVEGREKTFWIKGSRDPLRAIVASEIAHSKDNTIIPAGSIYLPKVTFINKKTGEKNGFANFQGIVQMHSPLIGKNSSFSDNNTLLTYTCPNERKNFIGFGIPFILSVICGFFDDHEGNRYGKEMTTGDLESCLASSTSEFIKIQERLGFGYYSTLAFMTDSEKRPMLFKKVHQDVIDFFREKFLPLKPQIELIKLRVRNNFSACAGELDSEQLDKLLNSYADRTEKVASLLLNKKDATYGDILTAAFPTLLPLAKLLALSESSKDLIVAMRSDLEQNEDFLGAIERAAERKGEDLKALLTLKKSPEKEQAPPSSSELNFFFGKIGYRGRRKRAILGEFDQKENLLAVINEAIKKREEGLKGLAEMKTLFEKEQKNPLIPNMSPFFEQTKK